MCSANKRGISRRVYLSGRYTVEAIVRLVACETADGAVSKGSHVVGQAHATRVLAGDDDGCRDVLHHHEAAAAHGAAIGRQQEGLGVLSGGEADAVVEDAPVAAVGGVPHRIAPLRDRKSTRLNSSH